jgi:hypothetical protein
MRTARGFARIKNTCKAQGSHDVSPRRAITRQTSNPIDLWSRSPINRFLSWPEILRESPKKTREIGRFRLSVEDVLSACFMLSRKASIGSSRPRCSPIWPLGYSVVETSLCLRAPPTVDVANYQAATSGNRTIAASNRKALTKNEQIAGPSANPSVGSFIQNLMTTTAIRWKWLPISISSRTSRRLRRWPSSTWN